VELCCHHLTKDKNRGGAAAAKVASLIAGECIVEEPKKKTDYVAIVHIFFPGPVKEIGSLELLPGNN
jgi:hypothetical protein